MKIETKYDVGEELWHLYFNKAQKDTFTHLKIVTYSPNELGKLETEIKYGFIPPLIGMPVNYDRTIWVGVENVFRTKEELLASL